MSSCRERGLTEFLLGVPYGFLLLCGVMATVVDPPPPIAEAPAGGLKKKGGF